MPKMVSSSSITTEPPTKHPSGFTLIELLVVIAIIAVLSAISVLTYRGFTDRAKDTKRKAELSAIAKVYLAKAVDNNKFVPLQNGDFGGAPIPKTPEGNLYPCLIGPDSNCSSYAEDRFAYCVSLGNNQSAPCLSDSPTCFCQSGGAINTSSSGGGGGGGGNPSCDPYGMLSGPFSGLVGYWKMDEGAWSGTSNDVMDSSGNNNNGKAYNGASITTPSHSMPFPPNIPPSFQNAGNFDGSDDYVSIANSIYFGTTLSISAWFKTSSTSGAIFGTASPDENYVGLRVNSSKLNGMTDSTSLWQSYDVSGATNVNDGAWHHAVFVINNTRLYMYLDGGLDGSDTILDITAFSRASFASYTGMSWSAQYFNGQIDDVRIYNRALSGGFAGSEISLLAGGCI